MTGGDEVNFWGSTVALLGSSGFIAVYSLRAPWWRSTVGRLLVFKASALSVFMAISIASAATDADLEVLRIARGVLAGAFGVAMFFQSRLVVRETRREGSS